MSERQQENVLDERKILRWTGESRIAEHCVLIVKPWLIPINPELCHIADNAQSVSDDPEADRSVQRLGFHQQSIRVRERRAESGVGDRVDLVFGSSAQYL